MSRLRNLAALAFVGALLIPAPVSAAWAAVGGQSHSFNSTLDGVIDLPSATTPGNHVIILVTIGSTAETVTITGTTMTFTLLGPYDNGLNSLRHYIACATADGDDTFTVNTTSVTTQSMGAEFSGGSCTVSASVSRNDVIDPYDLTADLVVPGNALMVSLIRSTTAATWTKDATHTYLATATTSASASFRVVTAGTYDSVWTAGAAEIGHLMALAYAEAAPGGGTAKGRLLMGCCGEGQ